MKHRPAPFSKIIMNTSDPRRGVPSCSTLHRLEKCPASWSLEKGMPDTAGADAESGTRIHEWVAGFRQDGLSPDEENTGFRILADAETVVQNWFNDLDATTENVIYDVAEDRIGLTNLGRAFVVRPDDGVAYVVTGQADRVIVVSKDGGPWHGLILDYKTGRGEVEHAADNAQLRGLAVLAAAHYGLQSVRVAIVQPLAGAPTVADYDFDDLKNAKRWLFALLDRVKAGKEAPTAGEWCKYCRAAERPCPALVEKGMQPVRAALLQTPLPAEADRKKAALFARAMERTPEELAILLDQRAVILRAMQAVEGAARMRMERGEDVPGWSLKAAKPRESITDVGKVWSRLDALGCQADTFTAACSITKKALAPIVRSVTGERGRGLEVAMSRVLEGVTTPGKPSIKLVRVGEQLEDEE